MSSAPTPLVSAEEYLALERKSETRSELINGRIYAMSGASLAHTRIVTNLIRTVSSALEGRGCDVLAQDLRVKVSETGMYTYPDVSVVCDAPQLEDVHHDTLLNPLVLIQVLSDSTEAYDRGLKFLHYQRIDSLQGYLLVSQKEMRVECFTRTPEGWTYTQAAGLEASIAIPALDIVLPLKAVYERVQLEDAPSGPL